MIYKKIKEKCKENKISIRFLEQKLKFGNGSIGKWKTSIPSAQKLQKVADFFEVKIDFFLEHEGEER